MSSLPSVLVFVCIVLIAGGLVLLGIGLRGRRLNDHPVCRGCRFDLFGLGAESRRCPECGADLGANRAVKVGVRRKRRGVVLAGSLTLLLGLSLGGLIVYQRAAGVDWNKHKPTWLLVWQTGSDDAAALEAVLAELAARYTRRELSDDTIARLVADGLVRQGNPNATWPAAWSDLIEDAILRGAVSTEDASRYFKQAIQVTIT